MKKFIYLLFFQILFYPCFADDFIRPNWKEFCPKRYENVNKDVWRYTSSGRYWSKRKKDFEVKLKNCDRCYHSFCLVIFRVYMFFVYVFYFLESALWYCYNIIVGHNE